MIRLPAITTLILASAILTGCQSLFLMNPTSQPAETTKTTDDQLRVEKSISSTKEEPIGHLTEHPKTEQSAPEISVTKTFIQTPAHIQNKLVLGFSEEGLLPDLGLTMHAKIDTGAARTSLDTRNIQQFERDGRRWVKFELHRTNQGTKELELPMQDSISIKRPGEEAQKRPVVHLAIQVGNLTQTLSVSLNDRSGYEYPMLIGRDFLKDLAIADVGKNNIAVEKPLKSISKKLPESSLNAVDQMIYQKVSVNGLPIFGALEYAHLSGVDTPLKARIDTGAETSSLDGRDIEEFKKNGKPWVRFKLYSNEQAFNVELPVSRFVSIKRQGGLESQRRPVVSMKVKVGTVSKDTEFTLRDRSSYEFPVLIAEQFLANTALVDVSQEYIADKSPRGNQ